MRDKSLRTVQKKKREQEEKRRYLDGIRRYQSVGVTVLVDRKRAGSRRAGADCGSQEDGAFYMGDYITDETGKLVEIHFDKVYHR